MQRTATILPEVIDTLPANIVKAIGWRNDVFTMMRDRKPHSLEQIQKACGNAVKYHALSSFLGAVTRKGLLRRTQPGIYALGKTPNRTATGRRASANVSGRTARRTAAPT